MANERITFSITLDRDTALHLQAMAHDSGLLLSEMAASTLAAVAEDDRRAHEQPVEHRYKPLYRHDPASGMTRLATKEERDAHPGIDISRDDREDEAERRRCGFKVVDCAGDVRPVTRVVNEGVSLSLDEIAEHSVPQHEVAEFFSGCEADECQCSDCRSYRDRPNVDLVDENGVT